MSSAFERWVCIFPGKMGLSWKHAHPYNEGTKEEMEKQALQNCNVVAVPLTLFNHIKDIEKQLVVAERELDAVHRAEHEASLPTKELKRLDALSLED